MITPKAIILSKNQIDILSSHSKENSPNESCAILFGSMDDDSIIVKIKIIVVLVRVLMAYACVDKLNNI